MVTVRVTAMTCARGEAEVKLEKCALCGHDAKPAVGTDKTCCANRRCPQWWTFVVVKFWNRLQRAIRKAAPAGRVLAVKELWCPKCHQVKTRLLRGQKMCLFHTTTPLVRVEVREGPG